MNDRDPSAGFDPLGPANDHLRLHRPAVEPGRVTPYPWRLVVVEGEPDGLDSWVIPCRTRPCAWWRFWLWAFFGFRYERG